MKFVTVKEMVMMVSALTKVQKLNEFMWYDL